MYLKSKSNRNNVRRLMKNENTDKKCITKKRQNMPENVVTSFYRKNYLLLNCTKVYCKNIRSKNVYCKNVRIPVT